MRYRKKPVVVEARQITGPDVIPELAEWCAGDPFTLTQPEYGVRGPHGIVLETLEGEMHAEWGDWIIKEPFPTDDRKFYPCKPDIFEATYEAVE